MFNLNRLIYFFSLVILITSCDLNNAKQSPKKEIIIASDFLCPKDTSLFYAFTKENGIHIKIVHLTADSIKKKLYKNHFNSKIDLVFVNSLNSVKELNSISFHRISESTRKENMSKFRAFKNNTWFAVGLDPFGFSYVVDSLNTPKIYSDLNNKYKFSNYESTNTNVFLAHLNYLFKKNPDDYIKWKKSFVKNLSPLESSTDSLTSKQLILINWSNQLDYPHLPERNKRINDFNLNQINGLFADRKCLGIVKEAENFSYTLLFLSFLNKKINNLNYVKKLKMLPINSLPKEKNTFKIMKINEDSLLKRL